MEKTLLRWWPGRTEPPKPPPFSYAEQVKHHYLETEMEPEQLEHDVGLALALEHKHLVPVDMSGMLFYSTNQWRDILRRDDIVRLPSYLRDERGRALFLAWTSRPTVGAADEIAAA